MANRVVWSNLAQQTLLDIYVTIGLENPAATERLYDRLKTRASDLADQPRMGPRRPDIRAATRILVEHPYLILYETRLDADQGPVAEVEIVAIIDGRRDLEDVVR